MLEVEVKPFIFLKIPNFLPDAHHHWSIFWGSDLFIGFFINLSIPKGLRYYYIGVLFGKEQSKNATSLLKNISKCNDYALKHVL
jgi:hypothetical protein